VGNLIRGILIGLIAAWGCVALGADWRLTCASLVIPILFAFFDVLTKEVFTIFLVFGVGALIWSYTPLGDYAADALKKISPQSFPAPPTIALRKLVSFASHYSHVRALLPCWWTISPLRESTTCHQSL
jgi:hypothetical protein